MLIDSHCHLDAEQFDSDREDVIKNAFDNGVSVMVSLGADIETSKTNIRIAGSHDGIYAACGIHPENCLETTSDDIKEIFHLIEMNKKIVAVGEIGLDLHYAEAPIEKQIEVLIPQMDYAESKGLPWVIHCRDAENELKEIIEKRDYDGSWTPGVIHCFNGSAEAAEMYMEKGFYVSLGCYIGYPSARNLVDIIKKFRLDRIMLETDSPYLPPQKKRGQRNEPAYVVSAAEKLAEIFDLSVDEIARITTENARRFFKLS